MQVEQQSVHLNKKICPGDNEDLTQERLRSTFNTDVLAAVIKGGEGPLRRLREIYSTIEKYPVLQDRIHPGHLSRVDKVQEQSRKMRILFQSIADVIDPTDPIESLAMVRDVMGIEGYPLVLHMLMFVPTIQNQCDEEQQEWWLEKAMLGQILGTYAQTELGHGTNLSKIETLATYDKHTEEFVLLSPTTTSLKWWPGGLGCTANHVVLVANLVLDGKNYGPHNFFVQIRDMTTHKPLPGVRVGDIGSKMGIKGVDNGFLGFDSVRIPRRNMLARHTKVNADGTYIRPAHPKVGYTTMLYVRSEMINHQSIYLMHSLSIAIRYSCIRRQGEITPGAGEVRILDYQTQQHRLFPHLARTFAFHYAGVEIRRMATSVLEAVKNGETEALADIHALSCCLKAVVTFQCGQGVEQCRMACGGHGYSDASNLPVLYASATGSCTYEGENMVMLLQTARYLMRSAQHVREGKSVAPLMDYLVRDNKQSLVDRVPSGDYAHYFLDFEHIARRRVFEAYERQLKLQQMGMSAEEARNANGVEMCRASRAHAILFLARTFASHVTQIKDGNVRDVVGHVLHMYLNHELINLSRDLLADNYMTNGQLQHLKNNLYNLYSIIRPNAVSLVDSFDITDKELRSVLGRRDGHVYENMYKWAQQSPLNEFNRGENPMFEKYLKPLMAGERSKL